MSVLHLVYGLRVASNLPLPCLPVLEEICPAHLQITLKQPTEFAFKFDASGSSFFYSSANSDADGRPLLRVCTVNQGAHFVFLYSDGPRFAVDRAGQAIWADWPDGYSLEDACTYLVGPVIAFALRLRGAVCLHASAIAVGDQAIALVGVPGAGKSTMAAAFAHLGFPVLSDDVAVLTDQGDQFLVQPGYPRINLWPDSVRSLFGTQDALPPITPTWDKRYLALGQNDHRFQAIAMPLGAVYILGERDPAGSTPMLEKLEAREAFMMLVANTYVNYLLDGNMRNREFDVLSRLVANLPVRRANSVVDPNKIFELCETISADARHFAGRNSTTAAAKSS